MKRDGMGQPGPIMYRQGEFDIMAIKGKASHSKLADKYGKKKAGDARWDEVDGQLVCRLVVAVSSARCAVLFGHTRDGGALALTFFDGDEKYPDYHRIDDQLNDWMEDQVLYWEGYADEKAVKGA